MTALRWSRTAVLCATLGLVATGIVYQAKGNHELLWGTQRSSAVDLLNRDLEMRIFVRGQNPFDHVDATQPPWGYPFGLLLTWPEWPAVRPYFAGINALALALLLYWVFRYSRHHPLEIRVLLMAAVFAFGGSCTATEVGQVSIIITALLAGALLCDEAGHPYWCGVLVALSLIKPTISAPFAIALLVTGRYRAAFAAAAYGGAATAFTWLVTDASPIVMLQQMSAAAARYVADGTYGVMDVLAALGVTPSAQVFLTPVIVTLPGIAAMLLMRGSLPYAFAVAAVWGRLWTYHKTYDDVMLAFLLVTLGAVAFTRQSRVGLVTFGAVSLLLWLPGRVVSIEIVQIVQLFAWPFALTMLMALALRGSAAAATQFASPPPRVPLTT